MKIAFLGDSITEGIHGCSYIDILQKNNPTYQIDNYGVGGDTVKSLYKRIQTIEQLEEYELVFLFIGVNDILGKLSRMYKLIKIISKQPCAKDITEFELYYNKIIQYLLQNSKKLIVMPPLFIGENKANKWNQMIDQLVESIESILVENSNVDYLDIRASFYEYLEGKEISDYIPIKAMDMKQDGDDMKNGKPVEEISLKRGLHTTIDGVHINTIGANIIVKEVEMHLKKE